jgi:stage III sporulation protein AD
LYGIGLIALVIIVILRQYKPEYTIYASLIAGALILTFVLTKISGIVDLLDSISSKAGVNNQFLGLLLKMTGIAFLIEYAVSICKDSRRNGYC